MSTADSSGRSESEPCSASILRAAQQLQEANEQFRVDISRQIASRIMQEANLFARRPAKNTSNLKKESEARLKRLQENNLDGHLQIAATLKHHLRKYDSAIAREMELRPEVVRRYRGFMNNVHKVLECAKSQRIHIL